MASVGFATLQIIPSLRGMERAVETQLGALTPAADRQGNKAGQGWFNRFDTAVSRGVGRLVRDIGETLTSGLAAAGAVAGGLLATSLFKGWDRFTTIEDATAALTVHLGDAGAAATFLDDILGVVTGTPFNLDQFASAGAQLVGFGVDVERIPGYLTAIGEASATQGKRAGEFADRLSTVFGQVATSGRISLNDVWRISDTGVNALAILANRFDVTTDSMRDMISAGAVPATEALDALAAGIIEGSTGVAGDTIAFGGTMEGLRETLTGAKGGFGAALARFGAKVIAPFASTLTDGFTAASGVVDALGDRFKQFAERIGESSLVRRSLDWFIALPEKINALDFSKLDGLAPVLGPVAGAVAGLASTNLAAALGPLGALVPTFSPLLGIIGGLVAVSPELRTAFGEALTTVFESLAGLGPTFSDALEKIADAIAEIATAAAPVVPILADLAVLFIETIGVAVITAIAEGIGILAQGVTALGDAFPLVIVGLVGFKIGMAAVTAVMAVNPIGALVTGIAALAVGLVWAYQNVEWFRNIIDEAFSFIAAIITPIIDMIAWYFTDYIPFAVGVVVGAFNWIVDAVARVFTAVGDKVGLIRDTIVNAFNATKDRVTQTVDSTVTWVRTKWDSLVGFIRGIPSRIRSAASGMWDGIKEAFRSAMNWIIDKWNGLEFTIGGGSFMGIGIPSTTLGVPDIRKFHDGGVVPGSPGQEVLAVLMAGETVLPTHKSGSAGMRDVHYHFPSYIGDRTALIREMDWRERTLAERVTVAGVR